MFSFYFAILSAITPPVALAVFAAAALANICLAGGLHGYLLAIARYWERAFLTVAGVLLIVPEIYSSVIGLVLLAVVIAAQLPRRHAATSPASEAQNPENATS
jgi:TRAP-type uncharacterized transport system fused permease subunit